MTQVRELLLLLPTASEFTWLGMWSLAAGQHVVELHLRDACSNGPPLSVIEAVALLCDLAHLRKLVIRSNVRADVFRSALAAAQSSSRHGTASRRRCCLTHGFVHMFWLRCCMCWLRFTVASVALTTRVSASLHMATIGFCTRKTHRWHTGHEACC